MKDLRDVILEAEKKKIAIGHFNVSNLEMLKAVVAAARKLDVPVVIGVSEGEREYIGVRQMKDLVDGYNKEYSKKSGFQLFLNADHTYSVEKAKEAIDLGYDTVVFDGAGLPLEENIRLTKELVDYLRSGVRGQRSGVLIEGELGYIGKSSKILEKLPEEAKINLDDLPTAEEARKFVKETGVHLLAPAVGNVHGIIARTHADLTPVPERSSVRGVARIHAENPKLHIERIREIKGAVKIPLVLHGGSGVSDADFRAAIKAGISLIHVSTELRVAWRKGMEEAFGNNPDEIAPYKIAPAVLERMERVIEDKLRLFNAL